MLWYELPGLTTIKKDQDINNDCLVLDFGHGGNEPGCLFYDGTKEKDYVLSFGLVVYNILKPYFKKIILTRTSDKTVSLSARTKIMKELAAKYNSVQVYSIHCNAYNKVTRGVEWLLSISTKKTHEDYIFCKQFLTDYSKTFSIPNRGIQQRKGSNGDYYYLHKNTPSNCKVKYIELFFGDNRDDCKKGQTAAFKDKASFFLASYILKRWGLSIPKPQQPSDTLYLVQAGAFSNRNNAEALVKKLKSKGFDSIIKTQKK